MPDTVTPVATPRISFEKVTLPNGLQLILHADRKLPVVHVNQWYHVGSKNERRGRTGFAHLFEHVMFQGSLNASADYFSYVEKAGANLREGGVNGTTSADRTNYFATVPSGNLEYLLWVESDRLATLADALTQKKLDMQREVVRNERRQSYDNQPYGRALTLVTEHLHPPDHPYSWPVIGSHEDLIAASVEDVKEFFERFYTPNNLTLVIAGDFDRDHAVGLVQKYYGGIPAGPALERPARYIPTLHDEKIVEVSDRVPQDRTYFAWPSVPYFDPAEAHLDVASLILSDGLSSRLNRRLVYDETLATDVSSFHWTSELSGIFMVVATARPGESLSKIEEAITEEIARLAEEGPTSEELDRAKTKWEYDFVTGLERIGGFGGKADRLAQYNVFLGDPAKFDEDVERYRSVTAATVQEAVGKWINHRNRLLVRFHPETSIRTTVDSLDRSQTPDLGEDRHFEAPVVQSARLTNGMDLFVIERHDLPKVAVNLVTRAGAYADPPGREGAGHLVAQCLALGTDSMSALEIEDRLGDLGTSLSAFAGREYSAAGFDVLERNLEPAMKVFADAVINARFPESEVARERSIHLDALAQQSNNPSSVAARIRPMLAFGKVHPYGRPAQGLPSSVAAITAEDLAAFHSEWWKAGSSAIIFAGDITLERARALAEKSFGDWRGEAVPPPAVPPPALEGAGKIFLVDRQDASQTVVMQILPAPGRHTDDYYALRLVDAVWGGGGFRTRLNLNLREDKGYAYGIFSNLVLFTEAGSWWAGGSVQTDKTTESVAELIRELDELATSRPVTAEELSMAQESRIRGYAQQFESLSRITQQVGELWAFRLPMSEMQREIEAVRGMTVEGVSRAIGNYVKPDAAALLLVGDVDRIEPGLRRIGRELVLLDVEGNRIR